MEFNLIELWPSMTNCTICNEETPLRYSIPMYEGKIVNPEKTDDWAGVPVCKKCYDEIGGYEKC